jgi:ELWxxDGT repeat protein
MAYSLFAADDGVHGQTLWRSDGTAAGTQMVDVIALSRAHDGTGHGRRQSMPCRSRWY